jgi:hypothetical protein
MALNYTQWFRIINQESGQVVDSLLSRGCNTGRASETVGSPLNIPQYVTGSIGRDRERNDKYFPGSVSQFGIWSRVLSPTEIQNMFDEFKGDYGY